MGFNSAFKWLRYTSTSNFMFSPQNFSLYIRIPNNAMSWGVNIADISCKAQYHLTSPHLTKGEGVMFYSTLD